VYVDAYLSSIESGKGDDFSTKFAEACIDEIVVKKNKANECSAIRDAATKIHNSLSEKFGDKFTKLSNTKKIVEDGYKFAVKMSDFKYVEEYVEARIAFVENGFPGDSDVVAKECAIFIRELIDKKRRYGQSFKLEAKYFRSYAFCHVIATRCSKPCMFSAEQLDLLASKFVDSIRAEFSEENVRGLFVQFNKALENCANIIRDSRMTAELKEVFVAEIVKFCTMFGFPSFVEKGMHLAIFRALSGAEKNRGYFRKKLISRYSGDELENKMSYLKEFFFRIYASRSIDAGVKIVPDNFLKSAVDCYVNWIGNFKLDNLEIEKFCLCYADITVNNTGKEVDSAGNEINREDLALSFASSMIAGVNTQVLSRTTIARSYAHTVTKLFPQKMPLQKNLKLAKLFSNALVDCVANAINRKLESTTTGSKIHGDANGFGDAPISIDDSVLKLVYKKAMQQYEASESSTNND
jgi:hypothetical protein